ncbi:MAG: TolC family protein [Proteobacteria bacterium]|nr:TolC family protein [Pseudomonadota bacterium]
MTSLVLLTAAATFRMLTLQQALQLALERHPDLAQAQAQAQAAAARADQARAPLLPQLSGNASYQRTTGNFALRPGVVPGDLRGAGGNSLATFNFFNFGLSASQLVWDFRQTSDRWQAARANAQAAALATRTTRQQLSLALRAAFFAARAQRALVQVAREQLTNQQRHLRQVEGFVEVGTRPPIDRAQARSEVAQARLQLIEAENAYAVAKAQLKQAMGLEDERDFEVADETLPPVGGEERALAELLDEALGRRPELAGLEQERRSAELSGRAARGRYWPALTVSTSLTDAGTQLDALAWNWNAQAGVSWPLYEGGLVPAQRREAQASVAALSAQRTALRQQVRVALEQARLGVRAAKASLEAAREALEFAQQRLGLAEGRYETGAGSILELGDAQVALTQAASQVVQADHALALARAQLLQALGRE